MHTKIFFLSSILLFYVSASGAEKRSISPTTQGTLNQQLKNNILDQNLPDFSKALQDGAQVNTKFTKDMTTLHFAVARSGLSPHRDVMIKALLEHKAETNIKNTEHQTPLYMYICRNPNPNTVALLLDAKANPKITDNDEDSPLTLTEDKPILEVFLQKGFWPPHASLKLAIPHIEPYLLPFIPVKPLAHIVIEYAMPTVRTFTAENVVLQDDKWYHSN